MKVRYKDYKMILEEVSKINDDIMLNKRFKILFLRKILLVHLLIIVSLLIVHLNVPLKEQHSLIVNLKSVR